MAFVTAFGVVLLATPSLIKVAKLKHLVDEPKEDRKIHKISTPVIGGVTIFIAFLFACFLWFPDNPQTHKFISPFLYLMAGLVLLFFIGIKDDIIGMSPTKKIFVHIIVGFILVSMGGIKITSPHGMFGMDILFPEYAQLLISIFVYIVIVNAINLIDGIDGLASGISLIACVIFGVWFYYSNQPHWTLVSFSLAGALLGFLIFNFNPARIFMGDSGSLTIGAILSVLTIELIETPIDFLTTTFEDIATPMLAIAILAYPLLDTFRVFSIRLIKGKSPFEADNNHLHHHLKNKGYGHRKIVFIIFSFNLLIIATSVFFPTPYSFIPFGLCALIAILFIVFSVYYKRKK